MGWVLVHLGVAGLTVFTVQADIEMAHGKTSVDGCHWSFEEDWLDVGREREGEGRGWAGWT